MSKKSFTVFVIILIAVLGFLFWYFLFGGTKTGQGTPTQNGQTNLFPFGSGSAATTTKPAGGKPSATSTNQIIDLSGASRLPRLRRISSVPVAGVVAFDIGSTTMIRYIERATGHISETPSESPTVVQISNITIPKVYEAYWSSDGGNLILRYLKDNQATIRTFTAKIIASSTPEKAIQGSFLSDDIQSIAVSGNKLFYLSENTDGAQGIRANIDGTAKTAVFNSSFGDWTAAWNSKSVILYPRPSGYAAGSAYALDPANGSYMKEVGDVEGLAAIMSSDENYLLYSGKNGNYLGTAIINTKTNISRDAGIATLAEKCVWSKKQKEIAYCAVPKSPSAATYPDDWYKGKVSFQDSLWKINAATGETQSIMDPELEAGISMDMTNLSLDQSENALVFINKSDMTAWRFDINY